VAVEDFEQLAARGDGNPLTQLRAWLRGAGFPGVRLRPCDLAGRHFIIALARHSSQPAGGLETTLRQAEQIVLPHHGTPRI
jgi:hypothetical protein